MAAIFRYGLNDWTNIVNFVGNGRTRPQCLQRWTRTLNPKLNKDGWSKEEEQNLMSAVTNLGENAWTKVSKIVGTRSDVQCRYHYEQMRKGIPQMLQYSQTQSASRPSSVPLIQSISLSPQSFAPSMDIDEFLRMFSQRKGDFRI